MRRVLLAARVANDLYALKPGDNAAQRLMLLTNLDLAKMLAGLDRPLPMEAGTAGARGDRRGPAGRQSGAGRCAEAGPRAGGDRRGRSAEKMRRCGRADAARRRQPAGRAMLHPDRRVRLAAALAAVKLAPGESFPGASRVEPRRWAGSSAPAGRSSVLVGHPRGEDAQSLVGFMNELGYDGQAAYVGRALVERGVRQSRHRIHPDQRRDRLPPVKELVQWLRRDYRTARHPVGVMARGELLDRTRYAFARRSVHDRLSAAAFAGVGGGGGREAGSHRRPQPASAATSGSTRPGRRWRRWRRWPRTRQLCRLRAAAAGAGADAGAVQSGAVSRRGRTCSALFGTPQGADGAGRFRQPEHAAAGRPAGGSRGVCRGGEGPRPVADAVADRRSNTPATTPARRRTRRRRRSSARSSTPLRRRRSRGES